MKKEDRVQFIQQTLNQLFPAPPIPLKHHDDYTLLIAVLLSAQCTDKKVNEITPQLFAQAKDPYAMVKLTVSEIEAIIRPCGLAPTKARSIHALSQILIDEYQGKIPSSLEKLKQLPGVGHKTASVVTIHAHNEPAFPVDTHIHRCAKRWGLSLGKNVAQTEKDLKALFPQSSWIQLHLQIIYFARQYCPAKKHNIEECPICRVLS